MASVQNFPQSNLAADPAVYSRWIGYLKIQASLAQGAIPIPGVRVRVTQYFRNIPIVYFEGFTDDDGLIEEIRLPAPPRAMSLDSNAPNGGAVYQIDTSHPGYAPQRYQLEIFEGVTSILPVNLQLPEEE